MRSWYFLAVSVQVIDVFNIHKIIVLEVKHTNIVLKAIFQINLG